MENTANHITLTGTLASLPEYSHQNHERRFFRFLLAVERLSGTEDLLPVLAAEGFFLSFSAGCFAAALGRSGVLLALAAFGVRCLIVLPCSIYPAVLVGERNRWRKLAVCGALLLLGMALELTLVPRLVQWALGTLS